jgi:hypothetical protein
MFSATFSAADMPYPPDIFIVLDGVKKSHRWVNTDGLELNSCNRYFFFFVVFFAAFFFVTFFLATFFFAILDLHVI